MAVAEDRGFGGAGGSCKLFALQTNLTSCLAHLSAHSFEQLYPNIYLSPESFDGVTEGGALCDSRGELDLIVSTASAMSQTRQA
eukprot:373762-Rhodomonas_salina.4